MHGTLLQVIDEWTEILDEGGSVDVIHLDLAKAFDTVPHQRLLSKLSGYGVRGRILEGIKQFLTERRQKVRVGHAESTWSEVLSGVPQGSVLGPVLFVCCMNDLPDIVSFFIYMYADDTKLFRRMDNGEDRRGCSVTWIWLMIGLTSGSCVLILKNARPCTLTGRVKKLGSGMK